MSAAPETTAPGRTYEVRTYACQMNGADTRAWVLWETVDALINGWCRDWASVHSSRRAAGPALTLVPNGDGPVMLSARYEVSHD